MQCCITTGADYLQVVGTDLAYWPGLVTAEAQETEGEVFISSGVRFPLRLHSSMDHAMGRYYTKQPKFKVGDVVKFSGNWLNSTGQFTGEIGQLIGIVEEVKTLSKDGPRYLIVRWDRPYFDTPTTMVLESNMVPSRRIWSYKGWMTPENAAFLDDLFNKVAPIKDEIDLQSSDDHDTEHDMESAHQLSLDV